LSGERRLVVGVDVGSTSARAGIFDDAGRRLARAQAPFAVNRPLPGHAEHSSDEIWAAVCAATRAALAESGRPAGDVAGLAFDATCSLVLLDDAGRPVTVSTTGEDRWNVVMWADHRAIAEADEITATGHRALDFLGGAMSPEMELPKLVWLKRRLPASWARMAHALDLTDFLTWRATSVLAVSACTVTCKWTYLGHEAEPWPRDLFAGLGVADLPERAGLPERARPIGSPAGHLTAEAARELGLTPDCIVGVGLIDAHAGGLGLLGRLDPAELDARVAVIAGTSTCHMAASRRPRPVPGVWGPYADAMLPGFWLNEGGQSATGALLDHVLAWHAEGRALGAEGHARVLARAGELMAAEGPGFIGELMVLPDFNGNRSPLADPHRKGAIFGLTLDSSFDGLVRLYAAAAMGIAFGTRHVLDTLDEGGYAIRRIHLTGGHAASPLLVRLTADATGRAVELPRENDSVLLGSAIVATAAAAGVHASLRAAARAMTGAGAVVEPDPATRAWYEAGYRLFRTRLERCPA
jgi:FGGY-family pentulose kinase